MGKFIKGMELSKRFYNEVIREIINDSFPELRYSAGLIDYGSDVLGYDTEISKDHQWGPRLSIFLSSKDLQSFENELDETLAKKLPHTFYGYPTSFSGTKETYIRQMEAVEHGIVKYIIRIHTLEEFFEQHLGWDIHSEISPLTWLLFPQQKLLTISKGQLFHDDLGAQDIKDRLAYYPDDLWYYIMGCEWTRIGEEEAFMGRCGDAGDDIGSRMIASRMIQFIMNISFFQEKKFAPYSKWFGTAFNDLESSNALNGIFMSILSASDWKERENWLSKAYIYIAERHNALGITSPIEPTVRKYYDRDYLVLSAERFSNALFSCIKDPQVSRLNRIGNIDQITNIVAIQQNCDLISRTKELYSKQAANIQINLT